MKTNKYIYDFETLNEIVHGDLKTIHLIVLGKSTTLSDSSFLKNLEQALKRSTHHVKEKPPHDNKKEYELLIDANQYQIITDFINDIIRELNDIFTRLKIKDPKIEYKDDKIVVKL